MRISYDEAKRAAVLEARGLDFEDARKAFSGFYLTRPDPGHSEGEDRFHTLGMIDDMLVLIVWTEREDSRRIISMWKANEKERRNYQRIRDAAG